MAERRCVLCDQPAGDQAVAFTMTPEAEALLVQQFPEIDLTRILQDNALCRRCAALPVEKRMELARNAIARELESYANDLRNERLSRRIDIARTIESVGLTDETWDWLNLIGYAITVTQDEARAHDADAEWFKSYSDYKLVLVNMIAKDINTLGAIFLTLRGEWTHQAATLLRTLCESLITLQYIAQDKTERSKQFLGYAAIEEYKLAESFLRWESGHSKPEHVAKMEALIEAKSPAYEAVRAMYAFKTRKGSERPFRNWCNRSVGEMANATGSKRLYGLVYNLTSAYIHGSAWSLRAVGAFTRRGYDAGRALIDTSMLVRVTVAVWFEWAAFCEQELGWVLHPHLTTLKERLDALQEALDRAAPGQ